MAKSNLAARLASIPREAPHHDEWARKREAACEVEALLCQAQGHNAAWAHAGVCRVGVRADPLWRNPLCLAKARCLVGDPLTPKIAKRSLRGGTESEGQPSVQPRGGPTTPQRGGL